MSKLRIVGATALSLALAVATPAFAGGPGGVGMHGGGGIRVGGGGGGMHVGGIGAGGEMHRVGGIGALARSARTNAVRSVRLPRSMAEWRSDTDKSISSR
jgi:hypothetical protein